MVRDGTIADGAEEDSAKISSGYLKTVRRDVVAVLLVVG